MTSAAALALPDPFVLVGDQITIGLPGARAVFTTRRGGVSTGPYESLNLGWLTDDQQEAVAENRRRVAEAHGIELAWGRQVHATQVERRASGNLELGIGVGEAAQADGQATSTPGVAPTVLTADCLAVVIVGGGAVAAVHAGWRGLAGGIIAEGVAALHELGVGGQVALTAAIGPGAGVCCYEVGEEVHAEFGAYGDAVRRGRNLDLKAIAAAQLRAAGVQTVHDVGLCTICSDPELFFSHRRDNGVTGRQAAIAWLS
ncbi:MAG: polyphenol oxidase family protein [Solirubrobacteraceae bacterium]